MTVIGLNHHGITVSSIEETSRFFVDVLGFRRGAVVELDPDFTARVTGVANSRLTAAFVHGPGIDVELLQYEAATAAGVQPPSRPGSAHVALFVDDIAPIVEAARPLGWTPAGSIAPIVSGPRRGGRAAYLRDRDGATVELVEPPRQDRG